MKTLKFAGKEGRFTLVMGREEGEKYGPKVMSSTTEQPYVAVNFDSNGVQVGAMAITKQYLDKLLASGMPVIEL